MFTKLFKLALLLGLCASAFAAELPTAPSEELLKVYAQLRALRGSEQWAVTENVAWQREAATFNFEDGHLTFAEPVAGHVLAAYFEGKGSIRINAPTPALQRQLARFAGAPALEDTFTQAVFFFTDDSAAARTPGRRPRPLRVRKRNMRRALTIGGPIRGPATR
jgi:hypothetical protein